MQWKGSTEGSNERSTRELLRPRLVGFPLILCTIEHNLICDPGWLDSLTAHDRAQLNVKEAQEWDESNIFLTERSTQGL